MMMRLLACDWINKHQNVIISAPAGVEKTFLLCALAQKACREGYRAFYIRFLYSHLQTALPPGLGQGRWKLSQNHEKILQDPSFLP